MDIIYLAPERCNFKCKSCFPLKACSFQDEISADDLLNAFRQSTLLKSCQKVDISGGEPFLKNDLSLFIVGLASLNIPIRITTNGYFTDQIAKLLQQNIDPKLLSFVVSIDGLEDTHNVIRGNPQAFGCAIQSVSRIKEHGFDVSINSVIQADNVNQLSEFDKMMSTMQLKVNYIPEVDYNQRENLYRDIKYVSKMYSYLENLVDRKYVLSQAAFKITSCHAGYDNFVIAPDGKVAVCNSGYQAPLRQREQYIIGDLKCNDFDDIFTSSKRAEVLQNAVAHCSGCFGGCEVNREYSKYNLSILLTQNETLRLKDLITLGNTSIDCYYEGWHPVEEYDWGKMHWMSSRSAKVLYKIAIVSATQLNINYCHSMPASACETPMTLSIFVEGTEVIHNLILDKQGTVGILLDRSYSENEVMEIDFSVNRLWRPCDYDGGTDNRDIGISICSIETY